jgi:hypothetical protein
MKKNLFLLSLLTLSIMTYSCKKDKDKETTPTTVTYPNYSQLKVGNYWIYQEFAIDSLGNASPQAVYDSCYIEKDTLINGQIYFKMYKPPVYIYSYRYIFLRDSLHYIITKSGDKIFSSQDFETIFNSGYQILPPSDTISRYEMKMTNKNMTTITPAGTFLTSDYQETYYMYPNYSQGGNIRYKHTRYAENIGIVTEPLLYFVSNPNYTERRLVRYHLN